MSGANNVDFARRVSRKPATAISKPKTLVCRSLKVICCE